MLEAAYDHYKGLTRSMDNLARIKRQLTEAGVSTYEVDNVMLTVNSARAWINALADGEFDPELHREQYGIEPIQ